MCLLKRLNQNIIFFAGHRPALSNKDFVPGFFEASSKDSSDISWTFVTESIFRLTPWMVLHSIGTQYFQRSQKTMIPIFHALIPICYLISILNVRPVIFLLAQPFAVFLVVEIIPHTISGTCQGWRNVFKGTRPIN